MTQFPRPRKISQLSDSVHRKLNLYALAAGAAGAGLLSVPSAEADIVYTPAHVKMDKVQGFYPIDLDNNGVTDVGIWLPASCSSSACFFTMFAYPNSGLGDGVVVDSQGFAKAMHFDAPINKKRNFIAHDRSMGGWAQIHHGSTETSQWRGPWANNGLGVKHRYVGLKFAIGKDFHYGWARINFVVTGKGTFYGVLTGYAYETVANKGLRAGQTSGPGERSITQPAAVIRPTIKNPTLGELAAGVLGTAGVNSGRQRRPSQPQRGK